VSRRGTLGNKSFRKPEITRLLFANGCPGVSSCLVALVLADGKWHCEPASTAIQPVLSRSNPPSLRFPWRPRDQLSESVGETQFAELTSDQAENRCEATTRIVRLNYVNFGRKRLALDTKASRNLLKRDKREACLHERSKDLETLFLTLIPSGNLFSCSPYLSWHPKEGIHVGTAAEQTLPQHNGEDDPYVRYVEINSFEQEDYDVDELKISVRLVPLLASARDSRRSACSRYQIITCNTDIIQILLMLTKFTDDREMNTPIW